MIKKLTVIATIALSPMAAFANMWDTHAQSDARYGQPISTGNEYLGLASYRGQTWMVTEWFNADGVVESIAYYKLDGKSFSKSEVSKLCAANNFTPDFWTHVSKNVWTSALDQRYEQSSEIVGNKVCQRLILSTTKGFFGMDNAYKTADGKSGADTNITDIQDNRFVS